MPEFQSVEIHPARMGIPAAMEFRKFNIVLLQGKAYRRADVRQRNIHACPTHFC